MLYNIEFDDLFDSKRQAVVLFLSLERRYQELVKELEQRTTEDGPLHPMIIVEVGTTI